MVEEEEDHLYDDDNSSALVRQIRSWVQSLLLLSSQSGLLGQFLRWVIGVVQAVTGVRLLPVVDDTPTTDDDLPLQYYNNNKQKKKKKQRSQSSSSSGTKTKKKKADNVKTTTATTTTMPKTPKKSSSSKKQQQLLLQQHTRKPLKSNSPNYRIQRELQAFLRDPPSEHLSVQVGTNIRVWIVTMQGIGIYEGECFRLRIQFPPSYPTRPPSVYFLPASSSSSGGCTGIPQHEHVYTNGDICLSLLGKDWRPTMTAQSIALSILSILASAQHKRLPMDNARHAHNPPGQYQEAWVYHDDSC